ncbi:MAG: efflux RND transporter periplasmic adaptor subunit [Balneolaceae bacterium]
MKSINNITLVFSLLGLLFLSACGGADHTHEEDHAEEEEYSENALSVELSERQMKAVDIEIGQFSYLPLKNTVKANGMLELPPQKKADVSALVAGQVSDINVIEGDRVQTGQVLATIEDPAIIDMQQAFIEASEQRDYLEQDYERKKRLLDEGVGSQREFQESASRYRSNEARISGLRSKLELLGLSPERVLEGNISSSVPVRSPLDGFVRVVEVNTGSYINPGEHMFEVVDNSELHIDLMVYEKDLHRVKEGQSLYFRYANQPTSDLYRGEIFAVGKAFEQNPKAVRVHAHLIEEQPNLLPGMYVEAMIVTSEDVVRSLPEQAVVSDGGQSYIFIVEEEEHADVEQASDSGEQEHHGTHLKAVPVVTGTNEEGYIEIRLLEEITEERKVVTKGAFFVLSEMRKGEGGHHH